MIARTAILAASLLLAACAEGEQSCSEAIADDRARYGSPDDTSRTTSDDYSVTSMYWWSQGVSRTYVVEDGGCAVTRRTFSPI